MSESTAQWLRVLALAFVFATIGAVGIALYAREQSARDKSRYKPASELEVAKWRAQQFESHASNLVYANRELRQELSDCESRLGSLQTAVGYLEEKIDNLERKR